jgi:hypothetical protein
MQFSPRRQCNWDKRAAGDFSTSPTAFLNGETLEKIFPVAGVVLLGRSPTPPPGGPIGKAEKEDTMGESHGVMRQNEFSSSFWLFFESRMMFVSAKENYFGTGNKC